ncbi:hypothetical protein ACP4OV_026641 [Aristida adscensionis]
MRGTVARRRAAAGAQDGQIRRPTAVRPWAGQRSRWHAA